MSFLKDLFNPDGLVKIEVDEIPDELPTYQERIPALLRLPEFRSGELQKSCQQALLRHMDQGKPLGALMSPKSTRATANALLALSHPCPRHLDLFAYCIELFDNGEGGLRLKGRTAKKLQRLMTHNPFNLAKILKLHAGEAQFYQLTKPVHQLLAHHAVLLDDLELAQLLEDLERTNETPARMVSRMQRHTMNSFLGESRYIHDSAIRAHLNSGYGLGHEEIHSRISRFFGHLTNTDMAKRKFSFLPQSLQKEYWADGPSLTPSIEIVETELTLEEILAFPGIDQFLHDHSFHFLQELNISTVGGTIAVGKDQLSLIEMMTRAALKAGHTTDDIHSTSIFEMSRYRRQDILNRGEDMTRRWVTATLDLAAKGTHNPAGLAIIKVLLEHEGVQRLLGLGLSDKKLLAAQELTGLAGLAQGLSDKGRDQMMGRDLGL